MKHHYQDILELVTKLTRDWHREIFEQGQGKSTACASGPKTPPSGLIDPLDCDCSCVATPLWWDENGVPRFVAHHPNHSADIYAEEVALVLIACQSCRREFPVQMTMSSGDRMRQMVWSGSCGPTIKHLEEAVDLARSIEGMPFGGNTAKNAEWCATLNDLDAKAKAIRDFKMHTLADGVRDGSIHYGDPPNVGCCPAGPTMNCLDLRVLEFWHRPDREWERATELERELPDATDPEFER